MAVVPMPVLDQLLLAHTPFETYDTNAKEEFLKARRSFKPNMGIPLFVQGPGTIDSFAAVYEVVLKLAGLLSAGRFFGTQEDLGVVCILRAFAGDAVAIAGNAIDDTPPSDQPTYRLHAALHALWLAYLPPRAAADWRRLAASFD